SEWPIRVSINGNSPGREISLRSIDFTPPVDMKIGDLASGGSSALCPLPAYRPSIRRRLFWRLGPAGSPLQLAAPAWSLLRFGILSCNLLVHRPTASHAFNTADAVRERTTVETKSDSRPAERRSIALHESGTKG